MRSATAIMLALLLSVPALGGLEKYTFVDHAEEQRFRELIAELRCLVCQNQSLADSNADLAEDLRREAFNLMRSGRSNDEVIQFLVDRYGDFVRYRPPVTLATSLIWFGPLVLFIGALIWCVRIVRRQQDTEEVSDAAGLARAGRLLEDERE